MAHGAQQHDLQQFEQIMATVFTCRSIVKYNLILSDEQKGELLTDIDIALNALRTYLMTNIDMRFQVIPTNPPFMRTQTTPLQHSPAGYTEQKSEAVAALYKMYCSYVEMQKSHNIQSYGKRFNEVMQIMNELHTKCTSNQSRNANIYLHNEAFQCVIVFISDIYYMFMDFIRALSDIWQQSAVHPDTEQLTSPKGEPSKKTRNRELLLAQLLDAYAAQQRLDEQRGALSMRVSDVVIFLEALKQNANTGSSRYNDMLVQLNDATTLLSDLIHLVANYEKAATTLLSANK